MPSLLASRMRPGVTRREGRGRARPWCTMVVVYTLPCRVYTIPPWVHHGPPAAPRMYRVPAPRAARRRAARDGALGSVRPAGLGRRASARSGAQKCCYSYAAARRIARVRARDRMNDWIALGSPKAHGALGGWPRRRAHPAAAIPRARARARGLPATAASLRAREGRPAGRPFDASPRSTRRPGFGARPLRRSREARGPGSREPGLFNAAQGGGGLSGARLSAQRGS